MFNINFCRWLDLNRGPLALEATALPTEPQPLPFKIVVNLINWPQLTTKSVKGQRYLMLLTEILSFFNDKIFTENCVLKPNFYGKLRLGRRKLYEFLMSSFCEQIYFCHFYVGEHSTDVNSEAKSRYEKKPFSNIGVVEILRLKYTSIILRAGALV